MTPAFRPFTPDEIAARVARDIPPGSLVNLGIGQPTRVANFLPGDADILLHSENGLLGMGPAPAKGAEDPDLINASKKFVTEVTGASFFDSVDSFAMMRGGHLDICVLGAFQVSARGDLANWHTGAPDATPAVGGAMDLAIGARRIFVMMDHVTREGAPKLVAECSYPLTAPRCGATSRPIPTPMASRSAPFTPDSLRKPMTSLNGRSSSLNTGGLRRAP